MRCSAKRSGAVRRRSGTATDPDGPRKSGMPDLRAFKCRSRVNPRSVSAAHHFTSLHFTSLHFTSLHFTSLRAAPGRRSFSTFAQSEHRFSVAMADLFHVRLGQIERLHHRNGGADVAPALLLVERTIGGKQHVIRPEDRQPANGRRAGAGERGIAVEALKIIERSLLQLLQDERIILVRRARSQLIPAVRNAAFEIW